MQLFRRVQNIIVSTTFTISHNNQSMSSNIISASIARAVVSLNVLLEPLTTMVQELVGVVAEENTWSWCGFPWWNMVVSTNFSCRSKTNALACFEEERYCSIFAYDLRGSSNAVRMISTRWTYKYNNYRTNPPSIWERSLFVVCHSLLVWLPVAP